MVTASYPSGLIAYTTKKDRIDIVDDDHINQLQAEQIALQTYIGTNPHGSATDLTTRLAVMMATNGAFAQGTGYPASPIVGQPFFRTDLDKIYIRNAGDSAWDEIGASVDFDNGDYDEATATTERSTTSTSYVKLKELTPMVREGTITIGFGLRTSVAGQTAYGRAYVNGTAVGTEVTTTSNTEVSQTAPSISILAGDVISVYGKATSGYSCFIANLDVKCANPTIPQEASGF